jgi:hypothetical protein
MSREVDELRAQLRQVITLTDAASARPVPSSAEEAQGLVAAIAVAREAYHVLMVQIAGALARVALATPAEGLELVRLVDEIRRAGVRLVETARAADRAGRWSASS